MGEPLNTKTWQYDDSTWSDLLTNFNGKSITYDEIGNPLTIGSKSLTWTGRQLQGWEDEENSVSYSYNGDGLRTSKTVNDETTNYYYNGSILAGQKSGDDTLVFMYDNNSDIFGFIYNDTEYYYIKNAQYDVIAIADADGNVLVKYFYDAWGKVIAVTDKDGNPIADTTDESETVGNGVPDVPLTTEDSTDTDKTANASNDIDESVGVDDHIDPQNNDETTVGNGVLNVPSNADEPTTVNETTTEPESNSLSEIDSAIAKIANLNPILYRSYYYDKETEWYYLNTRYYSPDMCRFINADGYVQTGQSLLDKNMFAYCLNNPVNYKDANGNTPEFFAYIGAKGLYYIAILAIFVIVIYAIMASSRNTSIYEEIYDSISYQVRKAKTRAKAKTDAKAEEKSKAQKLEQPTYIYRYGGTNPGNLTPSKRDVDLFPITGAGLSFSTIPKKGAAVTTIEALNATGVVYAVKDGGGHVSVYPIGGTLEDWYNAGSSSEWTIAVKSTVIKWDGGH